MNSTILIIEDDNDINNMLTILLSRNGYRTVSAFSGTEGLLIHNNEIDLILLDLMLPGRSGEEIIRVMSAVHDVKKKVDMFALGADDYVTKPFHNEELLARIAVRLRSGTDNPEEKKLLAYKDIELDTENFTAVCNGKQIEFSKHEFALLSMLMENPSRTCTKSMIYDKVWDYENSADDNTLNVHISRIRRKLKECNPEQEYIETVWGIGYRLMK